MLVKFTYNGRPVLINTKYISEVDQSTIKGYDDKREITMLGRSRRYVDQTFEEIQHAFELGAIPN